MCVLISGWWQHPSFNYERATALNNDKIVDQNTWILLLRLSHTYNTPLLSNANPVGLSNSPGPSPLLPNDVTS